MRSYSKKRFRIAIPSVPTSSYGRVDGDYVWADYLNKIVKCFDESDRVDFRCSDYVVPVVAFYQAPLTELMNCIDANVEVEVRLQGDYCTGTDEALFEKPLYWFARVIKVAGYRLFLRYEGMDQPGDEVNDFWVNISSLEVERVGYCCETVEGILIPPERIIDRHSDWKDYAFCRIHAYRTFPLDWRDYARKNLLRCKFEIGNRVELLDSLVSMRVRPATIVDIIGDRVLVKLSEKDLDDNTLDVENEDPQSTGVWMDQDSPLLFYVGWSVKVGYGLQANKNYVAHATEIANALKSGREDLPLDAEDAHPNLFKIYEDKEMDRQKGGIVEWKEGMKLEVLDPLDTWKELRVATVLKVLEDGYLKLGFDGCDLVEDTVPLHCSSTLLFPAGYAKKYGVVLKHPGTSLFDWESYLKECNADAAPAELFEDAEKVLGIEKFHVGAKLEAVDLCEPQLVCVATVGGYKGRLLKIKYDGWDDSFDQLFDYRSNNIYPLGWCEMYGYALQAPLTKVKKKGRSKR